MTGHVLLTWSALVALIQARAIVTNHCPHDVYIWSIPHVGSSHTDNLPIKPGGRYEEPWRLGTAANPGIALKISPQPNGIHEGKDEINFAYSIEPSDKSKVWVDLSPMRGKAFDNNLAFHTPHGAYHASDLPTQQCGATDDIELVLCDTARTIPAKDSTPFDKIQECYDYHHVYHEPSPSCNPDCKGPGPNTSEKPSPPPPSPTTETPPQSPPPQPTTETPYSPPPQPTSETPYYPPPQPTSQTPYSSPPQPSSEKPYSPPPQSTSERPYSSPPQPSSERPYSPPPQPSSETHYSPPSQSTSERPYSPPPKPTSEEHSPPPEHTSEHHYPPGKPTTVTPHYPPPQPTPEEHPSNSYSPPKPSSHGQGPPPNHTEGQYPTPPHTDGSYEPPHSASSPPHESTAEGPYSPPPKPTYQARKFDSKSTCDESQCNTPAPSHCLAKVVYPGRRAVLLRDTDTANGQVRPRTTIPLSTLLQHEAAKREADAQAVKKSTAGTPMCDVIIKYFPYIWELDGRVCDEEEMRRYAVEDYKHICEPEWEPLLLGVDCNEIKRAMKMAYPEIDSLSASQVSQQSHVLGVARNATLHSGSQKRARPKVCINQTCKDYKLSVKACEQAEDLLEQISKDQGQDLDYTTDDDVCGTALVGWNVTLPAAAKSILSNAPATLNASALQRMCSQSYCDGLTDQACYKAEAFLEQAAKDDGKTLAFTSDNNVCGPSHTPRSVNPTLNARQNDKKACLSWYCQPSVPGINCEDATKMLRDVFATRNLAFDDFMTESGPDDTPCQSPPAVEHDGRPGVCIVPLCSRMNLSDKKCENFERDLEDAAKKTLRKKIDYTTDDDVCGKYP